MKSRMNIGKALVLITQLAINMIVPIFICLFLGLWIDEKLGTKWIVVVFLFLGMFAAIRMMFITLRPFMKGEREKKDEEWKKQVDEFLKDSK